MIERIRQCVHTSIQTVDATARTQPKLLAQRIANDLERINIRISAYELARLISHIDWPGHLEPAGFADAVAAEIDHDLPPDYGAADTTTTKP